MVPEDWSFYDSQAPEMVGNMLLAAPSELHRFVDWAVQSAAARHNANGARAVRIGGSVAANGRIGR